MSNPATRSTLTMIAASLAIFLAPMSVSAAAPAVQTGASGHEQMAAQVYRDDAVHEGSALDRSYPAPEVLFSIYRDLKDMGLIKNGEGPLDTGSDELVVDEQLLRAVYDWATDNNLLTAQDINLRTRILGSNTPLLAKTSGACWGAFGACMAAYPATVAGYSALPCVAAAAEAGMNPLADAWCASQVIATGVAGAATCIAAIKLECKANPPDPDLFPAGIIGPDRGDRHSGKCTHPSAFIKKLDAWTRNGLITKVKATCNDGSTFTVGTGDGVMQTRECGYRHVLSGLRGKAGDYVDSVGLLCDYALDNGDKYKPVGSLLGGTGGTSYTSQCPNDTGYVQGLNARESYHIIVSNRKLRMIQAVCRTM